jgi:hypothetical protein
MSPDMEKSSVGIQSGAAERRAVVHGAGKKGGNWIAVLAMDEPFFSLASGNHHNLYKKQGHKRWTTNGETLFPLL